MMNKGKSLKMLIATMALSVSMLSCNQPTTNEKNETKDTTQAVATEAKVDTNTNQNNKEVSVNTGELKIVFIDTDSLVTRYKFFTDGNDRMVKLEASMRRRLENASKKLQKDYEEYMRQGKAGLLTLKQQQDTEADLTKRQQDLALLEQSLSEKLMREKQALNQKINETVATFIDAYRIEKGYTFILQKQTLNSVLSADPALDVTNDVIDRLNAKYEFEKKHN
ncbi:MAG: hypothetical protein DSY76_05625 [Bacteroidetes bacterium]|nr:MAG: hypothetical protein DSY76_05625 [Bacteroidota bacterium]